MVRAIADVSTVAILSLLGGVWYVSQNTGGDVFAQCRASQVAGGGGAIGGPFTLVDEDNKIVTDKDVITEPTLVYFGYTFCPDACPTMKAGSPTIKAAGSGLIDTRKT